MGGGILTGGRLLEGARGLGGELGHYRTHALDGVPCTCGATGCWERYAATTALVRAAQEMCIRDSANAPHCHLSQRERQLQLRGKILQISSFLPVRCVGSPFGGAGTRQRD